MEDIKERIEKLENELAELKKLANEQVSEQVEYKRWRAERKDSYYYLTKSGKIDTYIDERDDIDDYLYSIGNYFKTKEETEKNEEKLLITQQLKDLAIELNKGRAIDWNDNETKFCLMYDSDDNKIYYELAYTIKMQGAIYCYDENFKAEALKRIGEENLLKILKGE